MQRKEGTRTRPHTPKALSFHWLFGCLQQSNSIQARAAWKKPGGGSLQPKDACSLRLAAAAIRLRLRLLQYFSLYGLRLQQSKQLQQCRLVASRTRPERCRHVALT